mmetsp:Transcript_95500/g.183459  ORF Transcript_95500/g.183459 Transcript_95500/m.183459 type:complete len:103 (+) Transcript_95500:393-701(+)
MISDSASSPQENAGLPRSTTLISLLFFLELQPEVELELRPGLELRLLSELELRVSSRGFRSRSISVFLICRNCKQRRVITVTELQENVESQDGLGGEICLCT